MRTSVQTASNRGTLLSSRTTSSSKGQRTTPGNSRSKQGSGNPTSSRKPKSVAHPRDFTKYEYEGHIFGKGTLVHHLVGQYVKQHPRASAKAIIDAFSDVHPNLPAVVLSKDVKTPDQQKRYFNHSYQLIRTGDGKKVAVTREWGAHNFQSFLDHAKQLGFKKITPVK